MGMHRYYRLVCIFTGLLLMISVGATAQVKLSLGYWTGSPVEIEALQMIVDEFMERNPHIEVEMIASYGGPWGRDKYLTMFAGGSAPDLLQLNSGNFEMFAARGFLLPLDELMANDPTFDPSVFLPASMEGSALSGVYYGLPYDVSTHMPYYNRDMFRRMGLSEPGDWTWDELIEMARKLTVDTSGDGEIDVYGLGLDAAEWHWNSIQAQFDAPLFNEAGTELYATSPAFVSFMEWYFNLMYEERIAPLDAGGINRFPTQGVGIVTFGSWYRPELEEVLRVDFDYDLAYPPVGTKRGTAYYVDPFAIAATTNHPEEAWELLKFLSLSDAWDIKLAKLGGRSIPPLREAALSPEFLEYGGLSNYIILDSLSVADRAIAGLPSGIGREFLDIWWPEMWPAWVEPQPIRPLLENIQRIAEATLGLNQ